MPNNSGCMSLITFLIFIFILITLIRNTEYLGLIVTALLVVSPLVIYVALKIIKIFEDRENERRKNEYSDKLQRLINLPNANCFKVDKISALDDPYTIKIIKKFNDYILYSDYEDWSSQNAKLKQDDDVCLIKSELDLDIILFREEQLIPDELIYRIKLEYMYKHVNRIKWNDCFYAKEYPFRDTIIKGRSNPLPPDWEVIRKSVYTRDLYTCVLCGLDSVPLQAHHVWYRHHGGSHDINNLITLCRDCHGTLPMHENYAHAYLNIKVQNRKIIEHIYKLRPELVKNVILYGNPLLKFIDRKHIQLFENHLFSFLNLTEKS